MVERVADGAFQRSGIGEEFLKVVGIAGDVSFIDAGQTHQTPFIMVSAEPCFRDGLIVAVLCDFRRIQMAVVVNDREMFGDVMVEVLRGFALQEKVFVHEFHLRFLFSFVHLIFVYWPASNRSAARFTLPAPQVRIRSPGCASAASFSADSSSVGV